MPLLTLLTDFGLEDYYVAAVKGTVLRLAPGSQLVDVSHKVPPGDVETAAFLLAAALPSFPAGTIHMAVVDPGVGTNRRILAACTAGGSAHPPSWIVAPDNGLLTFLLPSLASVRAVERSDLFLAAPGQTFHGRDRFAPVAAWLLRGEGGEELGPEIADAVRLTVEAPRREPGGIRGRVAHVDRYGNLVTDIPWSWLPVAPPPVVEVGSAPASHWSDRSVTYYAEIPPGETAFLPGSLGTVELSMNGADLARHWKVGRGAAVRITMDASPGERLTLR
jgi:S-adenosylmethionine hydrolase